MGSVSDKIKGSINETVGSAKQAAGKISDSPELEGEGLAQELRGKGQTALGEAKDAVVDVLDTATTKVQELAKSAKEAIHRATE
jgi:uncharacterized protein YjbJ (UPF0337 family)